MLTDGGSHQKKLTLSHGWTPEAGYLRYQWDSYCEHPILLLLGLGSPTKPLPKEVWNAWARPRKKLSTGETIVGSDVPLFAHQYSLLFLGPMKDREVDYWANSKLATLRDRDSAARDDTRRTYREGFWGQSAGGSPDGYQAFSPEHHDGTVCPGCAGASVMFAPEIVLRDLYRWAKSPHRLVGNYGFADAVNLDRGYVDPDALGITVGPLYLALANLGPNHTVFSKFNELKAIRRAREIVGIFL